MLGAEEVYSSDEQTFSLSREKFLLVGGIWLDLMEGPSQTERSYNHIAFKIPAAEFGQYRDRLEAAGVEFQEGRPRIPGEGLSLYFYDYDNHLFELHTRTLDVRLEAYAHISGLE